MRVMGEATEATTVDLRHKAHSYGCVERGVEGWSDLLCLQGEGEPQRGCVEAAAMVFTRSLMADYLLVLPLGATKAKSKMIRAFLMHRRMPLSFAFIQDGPNQRARLKTRGWLGPVAQLN
jgi:hypothetical protein